MKTLITLVAITLLIAFSAPISQAQSQNSPQTNTMSGQYGIRGGLGTDVSLGLAFGVGGGYTMPVQKNYLEIGAVFFGGSHSETSNNGFNDYEETTDVFVVGAMANFLFGYQPYETRTYFIAGFGLASVSATWEETSETDGSLGTPLPGGGSMQSEDGGGGGTIFNLGVGHATESGLDLRAELPVIVAFSAPGEASAVIPTFMATVGYRF